MMKKFVSAVFLLLVVSAAFFAEGRQRYISPNNDGVQDELVIPLHITDKRYVASWALVIMDENKDIVRTIENKISYPERNIKTFFKQLFSVKSGVHIPESVTWNGALDSGEIAPDGIYYYYVKASDDNGNEGRTKPYKIVVDTIPPEVNLGQSDDKIFGEGSKSTFGISQTGSLEDEWIGQFKSVDGSVIKVVRWVNSEPSDFKWYGTNDDGVQIPDGVYSYEITATDRAGNVAPYTTIQNIIYSAEKPVINIFIEGSRYFSPNTASKKSSVTFNVTIPIPEEDSGNSLTDWSVTIYNEKGNAVRSFNKKNVGDIPPQKIVFDGKDDNGKFLPDGTYQAKVSASYLNGYISPLISSPSLVLDTGKPQAQFSVSDKVFGSGSKRTIEISMSVGNQSGAPVSDWVGKIISEDGTVVRTYALGEFPPEKISWNGLNDDGQFAEQGEYRFTLFAEDMAGNTGVEKPSDSFTFDSTEAVLALAANSVAFSPNGDKVKDTISFTPISQGSEVVSYLFEVLDKTKKVVYSVSEDKNLPKSFVWNGKNNDGSICKDGSYCAQLSINTVNGSSPTAMTDDFAIDTAPPSLVVKPRWTDFSPDGDGNQDDVPIDLECTAESSWVAEVVDVNDRTVKRFSWSGKITNFAWDGTDESGNIAKDGTYSFLFFTIDDAGNSYTAELPGIVLDSTETKAYIITESEGISPNGDGFLDTQKFEINASVRDNIISWRFDIKKEDGTSVCSWSEADGAELPTSIVWDGKTSDGVVGEGTFTASLAIAYKKGNRVNTVSAPFVCTVAPPQLTVQTTPEYFSPDNDGVDDDLFIRLSGNTKANIKDWSFTIKDPAGKPFWVTNGSSKITDRIVWDGLSNVQRDKNTGKAEQVQSATNYSYAFIVTDNLGMTSKVEGVIPIDVLVIRDGNTLKIAVPSIIFCPDTSEFLLARDGVTKEQVANNIQVLNRIASILKKFKDYKVTIVGHANRVSDNEEEEIRPGPWGRALKELSKERAVKIRNYLVKKGVSSSNLTTEGKGGTEPVADPKDKDNNWKNRRVEFILQK